MFSSFFQYLCLAPSFTNVLNVYAFCNLHDVSWGTKGSDKAEALPSVSSKKSKDADVAVVEDVARNKEDLDAHFKETVTRAVTKVEVKEEIEKPTLDDQNKTFRTRLVAFWMLTNAGLAVAIENINGLVDTTSSSEILQEEADLRTKQNDYYSQCIPGAAPAPPTTTLAPTTTVASTSAPSGPTAAPPASTGFVKVSGTKFTLNGDTYIVAGSVLL